MPISLKKHAKASTLLTSREDYAQQVLSSLSFVAHTSATKIRNDLEVTHAYLRCKCVCVRASWLSAHGTGQTIFIDMGFGERISLRGVPRARSQVDPFVVGLLLGLMAPLAAILLLLVVIETPSLEICMCCARGAVCAACS